MALKVMEEKMTHVISAHTMLTKASLMDMRKVMFSGDAPNREGRWAF